MNLTYQRRKAEKRCISCGAQTERTLAGMSRCSKCQKIAAIKRYERGEMRRKKRSLYMVQGTQYRKALPIVQGEGKKIPKGL